LANLQIAIQAVDAVLEENRSEQPADFLTTILSE
jgi:hypothetical protein